MTIIIADGKHCYEFACTLGGPRAGIWPHSSSSGTETVDRTTLRAAAAVCQPFITSIGICPAALRVVDLARHWDD